MREGTAIRVMGDGYSHSIVEYFETHINKGFQRWKI
jgi:hypothetical protein